MPASALSLRSTTSNWFSFSNVNLFRDPDNEFPFIASSIRFGGSKFGRGPVSLLKLTSILVKAASETMELGRDPEREL